MMLQGALLLLQVCLDLLPLLQLHQSALFLLLLLVVVQGLHVLLVPHQSSDVLLLLGMGVLGHKVWDSRLRDTHLHLTLTSLQGVATGTGCSHVVMVRGLHECCKPGCPAAAGPSIGCNVLLPQASKPTHVLGLRSSC